MKLVYEKSIYHCQCLQEIPTFKSTIQWETQQAFFPTEMVGPQVWIFLFPLNTNDRFYLSHIPVPALGKDKNRMATSQPHAHGTTICDVIVMLKIPYKVASQRI